MSSLGWHMPSFSRIICGDMSDRERLGFPNHYFSNRFEADLPAAYDELRNSPVNALVAALSDAPLVYRLAAGNLLALLSDPRIRIDDPAMVDIAGGKVEIGLPGSALDLTLDAFQGLGIDRSWIEKECPRHAVELASYRIAKYPVTNLEYRLFLLETEYPEIPTSWAFRQYPIERANHPVYTVTEEAASAYAAWLSARTSRRFRLPSEAEWEYAASGPEGLEFPWGGDFDADRANTAETGLFTTSSVGTFREGESTFGVTDMAGNVEEYVNDLYLPYPGGKYIDDDLARLRSNYAVARGGSFARFRDLARTRRRHGRNPRSAAYAIGFRLAEDPPSA